MGKDNFLKNQQTTNKNNKKQKQNKPFCKPQIVIVFYKLFFISFVASWVSEYIVVDQDNSRRSSDDVDITITFAIAPTDYGFKQYIGALYPIQNGQVSQRPVSSKFFNLVSMLSELK